MTDSDTQFAAKAVFGACPARRFTPACPRLSAVNVWSKPLEPVMLQKIKGVNGGMAGLSEDSSPDFKWVSRLGSNVCNMIKNEGISRDVYENKGLKFGRLGYPVMYMKTN